MYVFAIWWSFNASAQMSQNEAYCVGCVCVDYGPPVHSQQITHMLPLGSRMPISFHSCIVLGPLVAAKTHKDRLTERVLF